MGHKRTIGILLFITSVILYKFCLYAFIKELNFDLTKHIKALNGEKQKPSSANNDNLHNYFHLDPFRHHRELRDLGKLVQRRLHYIQNPASCNTSSRVNCLICPDCGFGSHMHVIGMCLMIGYATNRTVTVYPQINLRVEPLSTTCTVAEGVNRTKWGKGPNYCSRTSRSTDADKYQVIDYKPPYVSPYKPKYYPPAIPDDLADKIASFHSNPFLWWAGQMSSYVFRPIKAMSEILKKNEARIGITSPIVGVQIRRTDKVNNEAKYHSVDEYMKLVNKWYDNLERNFSGFTRRIFLATDDTEVKPEINKKYPQYIVLNNDTFTKIANDPRLRKTISGYLSIISDIHMLSKCDYLVCTFTSNICRLAYELMQATRGNVTHSAVSVDRPWFYWGSTPNLHGIIRAKMPLYGDPTVP